MKRLVFIRHAHTDLNSGPTPRIRGFLDVPLNSTGIQASHEAAAFICSHYREIDEVYSSPLQRCLQTAEIVREAAGLHAGITKCAFVNEVNWGKWEGLTYEEAMGTDSFNDVLPHHMNPPGGENLFAVTERCGRFLGAFIDGPDKTAVVVSHGSVISLLICLMLEIPINKYWTVYLSNAKTAACVWDGEVWRIEQFGGPVGE